MKRKIESFLNLGKKPPAESAKIRHDEKEWLCKAQEGEFRFHEKNKWRQSEDFIEQTIRLFDSFGFFRAQYEGKTIIDLGAGSKLRTKYFSGANLIVIEPLAERFLQEIEWCDLRDAHEVYSTPAEMEVKECLNRADLVISINVLDHCYDFEKIIQNIYSYLKDDGLAFISFDKHEEADEKHPLRLDEHICREIFERNDLVIEKVTQGANGILPGDTYGHGPYCLNYRLKKAKKKP
jgi:2-polyprenyl-3-methyl-5-hydroxy-6-metoxy-1,4-benzoquinol methylase